MQTSLTLEPQKLNFILQISLVLHSLLLEFYLTVYLLHPRHEKREHSQTSASPAFFSLAYNLPTPANCLTAAPSTNTPPSKLPRLGPLPGPFCFLTPLYYSAAQPGKP
jgi:hypothetical protein